MQHLIYHLRNLSVLVCMYHILPALLSTHIQISYAFLGVLFFYSSLRLHRRCSLLYLWVLPLHLHWHVNLVKLLLLLKLRSHATLQGLETDSDEFLEVHHVTLSLLNVILTSDASDVADDLLSHLHEVVLKQVSQGYLLLENSLDFFILATE